MRRLFLFLLLLITVQYASVYSRSIFGNLFDQDRKLFTSKTKYFDIIYPETSRNTAIYLASFADSAYEMIESKLDSKHIERITVIITADVEMANGFSSTVPYSHIVLLDYPGGYLFNSREDFRDLFIHELTHSITINTKRGLYDFLSHIFGNYISPNITMPEFMIEGSAVSFESLEGFGRAHDPYIINQIQQDVLERKFKTPAQVSGPYDLYPGGQAYYNYGGLFNQYVQKKYGMEKYARLWQENGGSFPYFTPLVFQDLYGVSLFKEWANFGRYIHFKGSVVLNTNYLIPNWRKMQIETPILVEGKIYFYDAFDKSIFSYDLHNKRITTILDTPSAQSLSVSEDGNYLLITMRTLENVVYKSVGVIYDLKNSKLLDKTIHDISEACYIGDKIVAIRPNGYNTDLVEISSDGSSRVLLSGNKTLSFSEIHRWSPSEVVFMMIENGIRKIAFYSMDYSQTVILEAPVNYIRNINVSENMLSFSYNNGDSLYQLGIINGTNLMLQTNNISGGVYHPLIEGDSIYYAGQFSEGDSFLQYPQTLTNFDGMNTNYRIVSWRITDSNTNTVNSSALQESNIQSEPYNPLPYLLPHVWLPYGTFWGNGLLPDSLGIYTILMDPIYQNSVELKITYNYVKPFCNASFNWENSSQPYVYDIGMSDRLIYYNSISNYVRTTSASFALSYQYYLVPANNRFTTGGQVTYILYGFENEYKSPYQWYYLAQSPILSLYGGYSTTIKKYYFYENKGFDSLLFFDLNPLYPLMKAECYLAYYLPILPVRARFNAAVCPSQLLNLSSQNFVFSANHYPAYIEYQNLPNYSRYYLSAEGNFPLFDWEIQQGPWLIPIYFNRLYLLFGYRCAYLSDIFLQSVYTRLNLESSLFYGGYVPRLTSYIETYYAITSKGWGFSFKFDYGF